MWIFLQFFAGYIPNFVKVDACYLPFRSKSFVETTCLQVIEHTKNPLLLMRELVRITNGVVIIKNPYRNVGHRRSKKSIISWRTHWLSASLEF